MRLFYKFLVEHGVIVPKPSHSRCSTIIDFFVNGGSASRDSRLLMSIKSKIRNRLATPGHNFRCAVSKAIPPIDQLVEKNNHILLIKTIVVFSVIF